MAKEIPVGYCLTKISKSCLTWSSDIPLVFIIADTSASLKTGLPLFEPIVAWLFFDVFKQLTLPHCHNSANCKHSYWILMSGHGLYGHEHNQSVSRDFSKLY